MWLMKVKESQQFQFFASSMLEVGGLFRNIFEREKKKKKKKNRMSTTMCIFSKILYRGGFHERF